MVEYARFRTAGLSICLFAFVALSIAVETNSFSGIDQTVKRYAQHHVTASRTIMMIRITGMGSADLTLGMAALLGALLIIQHSQYWVRRLLISVVGGMILNETLKLVFHRVRLHFAHYPLRLIGSFPSGHSLCATVLYGFLTVLAFSYAGSKTLRILTLAFCIAIVLMVSVSRIYLGVHLLSDVIGGVLEGVIWLGVVRIVVDRRRASAFSPRASSAF